VETVPASGTSPPVTATAALTERDLKKIRAAGLDRFDQSGLSQETLNQTFTNPLNLSQPVQPSRKTASPKPN
jgi:hypothetical protein